MDEAHPLAVPGGTIARQVAWLAGPVLVEQFLLYLIGCSDTLLTGRYLQEDHLAAVTVAAYLLWFLGSLWTIVSVGATALVARRVGAGDWDEARDVCGQALAMALVVGTLIGVVGWLVAPGLIGALNLGGRSAFEAARFLRIVLLVTPLLATTTVGIACLRGAGDTRTGMWVMVLVNAVNASVSWTLVRGLGPFPAIGLAGIASGTALGEGIGGVVVLLVLASGRAALRLDVKTLRPNWPLIGRIARVSLPAAGESLTNILCQLWFMSLINRLGTVATAAHGVALRCESVGFLTVTAFSVAAGTLTGQYLGAHRPDLAGRAARTSWAMGVLVLGLIGALIYIEAGPMVGFFVGTGKPRVAAEGVRVLRVVSFALPALATLNVLNGSLRGAGDTRWPWYIVLLGYLGLRLPLTYALTLPSSQGGFHWGLYGAWVAMFVDLHVRAVLVAARFLQGGWKRTRV